MRPITMHGTAPAMLAAKKRFVPGVIQAHPATQATGNMKIRNDSKAELSVKLHPKPTIQEYLQVRNIAMHADTFAQACREVGTDESKFDSLLRIWIAKPDLQRCLCYSSIQAAAMPNDRFVHELRLREERIAILSGTEASNFMPRHKFRRFLKSNQSMTNAGFKAIVNGTFLSRLTNFSFYEHMMALVKDYPLHTNLHIAIARYTHSFNYELCRDVRDILRKSGKPDVFTVLARSAKELSGHDAVRDLRATTEVMLEDQRLSVAERIEIAKIIVVAIKKIQCVTPTYAGSLLKLDALKLAVSLCAGIKAPQTISELELDEAIRLEKKIGR